jgi:DNA modification methylase
MKPYFERGGIQLFHGDCRDILPTLPVESMDLIIADPPYGVRWQSGRRNLEFGGIVGDDSTEVALAAIPLALRVLRRNRHVYLFGRYDLSSIAGIGEPAELIWNKGRVGLGDTDNPWGLSHEYIQFFANCKSGDGTPKRLGIGAARMRRGSVITVERPNGAGVSRHPTEKPLRLLRELIESSSKIGESVLDFFVGSGSTLEAACLEGRTAIGIEIEERYCEVAAKRLSQAPMDFVAEVQNG